MRRAALLLALARPAPIAAQGDAASHPASRPTAWVRGRCHNEAGAPLPGTQVQLVRFADDTLPRPARRLDQLVIATAQCDAAGEFRVPAEPGRWYWLWAARDDLRTARPMLRVVAGAYLDVPMAAGDVRPGAVQHAGQPVAGARITAWELVQPERCGQALCLEATTSAADGTFQLVLPAWLRPAVLVEAGAHVGATAVGGARLPLRVEIGPRPVVRVTVVDLQGRAVAGAVVTRQDPCHPPEDVGRTDAQGMARVPFHPAFDQLSARSTELAAAVAMGMDAPPAEGGPAGQRFILPAGLRLSGRLVDGARRPLTGRRLLVHSHDNSVLADPNPACRTEVVTDGDGRFVCAAVRSHLRATLYLEDDGRWVPLLLTSVERADLGDVAFAGAERLPVTVLDAEGTPVAGALVLVHRVPEVGFQAGAETLPSRVAFTDQAGRALLDALAPGPYRLLASGSGQPLQRATVTVQRGQRDRAAIRLPRGGGVIAGRVVQADGQPVPFADLQLQPFEPAATDQEFTLNTWTFLTGPDGRFRFVGLPETGQAWLMATASRHGVALSGNHQAESGQQEIELRLQ